MHRVLLLWFLLVVGTSVSERGVVAAYSNDDPLAGQRIDRLYEDDERMLLALQPHSLFGTSTHLSDGSWLVARIRLHWPSRTMTMQCKKNASMAAHNGDGAITDAASSVTVCNVLLDVSFAVHDATLASFDSVACYGEPAVATISTVANTTSTTMTLPFMFDPNDCVQRFLHPFRDGVWMGGNSSAMALSWNATTRGGDASTAFGVLWTMAQHALTVVGSGASNSNGGNRSSGTRPKVPTGSFCFARGGGNATDSAALVAQHARVDIMGPTNQALLVATRCNNASCTTGAPSICKIRPLAWDPTLREMYPAPPQDVVYASGSDRNYVPLSVEPGVVEPWWPPCIAQALQTILNASAGTGNTRYRWFLPTPTVLLLIAYPAAADPSIGNGGGARRGSVGSVVAAQLTRCASSHDTARPNPLWALPGVVTGANASAAVVVFNGDEAPPPSYCGSYGGMPSLRIELLNATRQGAAVGAAFEDSKVQYTTTVVWVAIAVSANGFDAPPVTVALNIYYADHDAEAASPVTVQAAEWPRLRSVLGTVGRSSWMQLRYIPQEDSFWCALSAGAFSLTPCA